MTTKGKPRWRVRFRVLSIALPQSYDTFEEARGAVQKLSEKGMTSRIEPVAEKTVSHAKRASPLQLQIFRLHQEGCTEREIAQSLGCSVEWVMHTIKNAEC